MLCKYSHKVKGFLAPGQHLPWITISVNQLTHKSDGSGIDKSFLGST